VKLKPGILNDLKLTQESHILMRGTLTPALVSGCYLKDTEVQPGQLAHAELGWSGLQILCVSDEAKGILQSQNLPPYALEGVGYISLVEKLFDDFDASKIAELSHEDRYAVTQFVTSLVACTCHPAPKPNEIIIVQLATGDFGFPEGVVGFQCHIIVPVEEGTWMGMYQIHTQELLAATKYYESVNGIANSKQAIAESLSPTRTLN